MTRKEQLLNEFSNTLNVFWSGAVSKRGILETWGDFLSIATTKEDGELSKECFILTNKEKERLYREAGLI